MVSGVSTGKVAEAGQLADVGVRDGLGDALRRIGEQWPRSVGSPGRQQDRRGDLPEHFRVGRPGTS